MLTKAQMWRAILNLADGDQSLMAQSERVLSKGYFRLEKNGFAPDMAEKTDPTLQGFVEWVKRFEENKGSIVKDMT